MIAGGRSAVASRAAGDPFGRPDQQPQLPPEIELVGIPSANHSFGTGIGIPRSATMTRITTAVTGWIERQLSAAQPASAQQP